MNYYDDPNYSYQDFWTKRTYEHCSELLALRTLLSGVHVVQAADVGGGYGRLTQLLAFHSKNITLVEPSVVHRNLAKSLKVKNLIIQEGTSENTGLTTESQDLVIMVRVMHHIVDTNVSLKEMNRILKPGGLFILEFANAYHFKARIKSWLRMVKITYRPTQVNPNTDSIDIPFVNHHPVTMSRALKANGFSIIQTLSVSNFRLPFLKCVLPLSLLLKLEKLFQKPFALINFGPSIFILAKRNCGKGKTL